MNNRVAMLLDHSGSFDSRVKREKAALKTAGYDIRVFCINRGPVKDADILADPDFVQCSFDQDSTIPFLSRARRLINPKAKTKASETPSPQPDHTGPDYTGQAPKKHGLKSFLGTIFSFQVNYKTVHRHVKAFAPDIIHAHDLSMLPAAIKLAGPLKAKTIYDSHEYERSRNVKISKLGRHYTIGVERRAVKKVDSVIVVSDSISQVMVQDHNIQRPAVILNSSNFDSEKAVKTNYRQTLGISANDEAALYIGALLPGRGLMSIIDCLNILPNLHVALFGPDPLGYSVKLLEAAKHNGVFQRLHISAPVAEASIQNLIAEFDISLVTIENTCLSYNYALPNKLFQSLNAGVPIVATPLKEISEFLRKFDAGIITESHSAEDIARGIQEALTKKSKSDNAAVRPKSIERYRWDVSKSRLLEIYEALVQNKPIPEFAPFPHAATEQS